MLYKLSICISLAILLNTASFGQHEKRVLVISGGGARGAWGAGLITALIHNEQPDYRGIFGTSTGSLMAPLISLNDTAGLKEAYTTSTQKDIFNVNPFKLHKNGAIKFIPALFRLITGKKNLGETYPLREKIKKYLPPAAFDRLRESCAPVYVSVTSLTSGTVQYKSSHKDSCQNNTVECYEDMIDWIWASSNQPLFMTTVKKDRQEWVDGGVKENVPVFEAVNFARRNRIKVIDVVVNNIEGVKNQRWPEKGRSTIIPKLLRTIDLFSDEVRVSDIITGVLAARLPVENENDTLTLNLYFMKEGVDFPANEFPHSLLFVPEKLEQLWNNGYSRIHQGKKAAGVRLAERVRYYGTLKVKEYY